jgi:hypothetical protein
MSQSTADKIFDKYSGEEGFTTVYITKYMFDLFRDLDKGKGSDEMTEAISRLNSIRIVATDDDPGTKTDINLYDEVMKELPESDYKELMVIKEKDENVKFLIKEKNKKVEELLLLVGSPEESVMIIIQGDIDMKNISSIAKSMDIKGMEKLEEMEE